LPFSSSFNFAFMFFPLILFAQENGISIFR
jgi:hypothetical protein